MEYVHSFTGQPSSSTADKSSSFPYMAYLQVSVLHKAELESTGYSAWPSPPNSPDRNPVDYSVWGALQQMVYRHKISHWQAETRANRLLGSAKPGHVKSSVRSATCLPWRLGGQRDACSSCGVAGEAPAVAAWRTHTQTPSVTISSPLA